MVEGDRMIMVQRLRLMVQQCTLNIITTRDLYDIIGNKMANDIGKSLIRSSFPLLIAGQRVMQ